MMTGRNAVLMETLFSSCNTHFKTEREYGKHIPSHLIRRCLLLFLIIFGLTGCAGISGDSGNFVWPPPPETPRIRYVETWTGLYDFGKQSAVLDVLMGPEIVRRVKRTNGVLADSAGNIFVADSEQRTIFVFDKQKKTVRFIGDGTVQAPIDLAFDNKGGVLFVSDSRVKKVFAFDANSGRLLKTMGGRADLQHPTGIVYDEGRERLYVSDTKKHVINVYDKDDRKLFTIGKEGNANGELYYPTYLAFRHNKLYVVDSFNFRVQIFDPEGNFLKKFGRLGDSSGSFARPHGIGVDSDGHIYVVDSAFSNFQIFNEDGRLLLWIGGSGAKTGNFQGPTGMFIDESDRIYVSDTFNRRVEVFQYLKEK